MSSILTYGGYAHTANEANLDSVSKQTRYSPRNKRLSRVETWHLSGELIYSSTATIISTAQAIVTAYSQDYQNATYTIGGVTAHSLLNGSDCISGVKVLATSFPKGDAAQLATTRSFKIVLQSTYAAAEEDLVSWSESLETIGTGGPKFFIVDTLFGPFQAYAALRTAQFYLQTGQAVGYSTYPTPPGPVNPSGEFEDRRRITNTSGRMQGSQIRFYTTKWSYYMGRDVGAFGQGDFKPTSK